MRWNIASTSSNRQKKGPSPKNNGSSSPFFFPLNFGELCIYQITEATETICPILITKLS